MWKRGVLAGLLALVLMPSVLALDSTLKEKIGSVSDYGSKYEKGEITYPQLLVITRGIAREVYTEILKETSEEGVKGRFDPGLSEETMREIFGEPTGSTNWIWVRNEQRAIKVDKQAPQWQKVFYDGDSLRITATVLPQAVKKYGPNCPKRERNKPYRCEDYTLYYFYDFVFNLRSKAIEKPNIDQIETDLKEALQRYPSLQTAATEMPDFGEEGELPENETLEEQNKPLEGQEEGTLLESSEDMGSGEDMLNQMTGAAVDDEENEPSLEEGTNGELPEVPPEEQTTNSSEEEQPQEEILEETEPHAEVEFDEETINMAFEHHQKVWQYVEDNKIGNDCEIVSDFIGGTPQIKHLRKIQGSLREFDRGKITFSMDWCEDGCDNQNVGLSIYSEFQGIYIPGGGERRYKEGEFEDLSIDEIKERITDLLEEISTSDLNEDFLIRVRKEIPGEIDALFHALSSKMGSPESPDWEGLHSWSRSMIEEFATDGDMAEEVYTRKEFERQLVTVPEGSIAIFGSCVIQANGNGGSAADLFFRGRLDPLGDIIQERRGEEDFGCTLNLASEKKEREMLEDIDDNFLKWFLEEYLAEDPGNWMAHSGAIVNLHGDIAENMRETVKALDCLNIDELPEEYTPINAERSTTLGTIRIFEEDETANVFEQAKPREILAPYLSLRIFPPKEVMKEKIKDSSKKIDSSYIFTTLMSNEDIKKDLESLGDKEMTQLINFKDGDETFSSLLITINSEGMDIRPATPDEDAETKIYVDLDFIYSLMEISQGEMKNYNPPWKEQERKNSVDRSKRAMKIVKVILKGFTTGEIKVEPATAFISSPKESMTIAKLVMKLA